VLPARLIPAAIAAAILLAAAPAAGGGRCGPKPCTADVGISGHAEPQPIHPREVARLKVTAKNNGYDGALDLDMQVKVPFEGLRIVKVRRFGGNKCHWKQGFVRCDLGDFRREQEVVVVIYVRARKLGTYISEGKVFASGIDDPNGGNNHVEMTVTVKRRS
jgi:hypothetical protein